MMVYSYEKNNKKTKKTFIYYSSEGATTKSKTRTGKQRNKHKINNQAI